MLTQEEQLNKWRREVLKCTLNLGDCETCVIILSMIHNDPSWLLEESIGPDYHFKASEVLRLRKEMKHE